MFMLDAEPLTLASPSRERLATVVDEAGTIINGHGPEASYLVQLAGAEVPPAVSIPESCLEPAGALGEKYERVLGPYTDFVAMWTEGLRVQRRESGRDVDILGVNWPEWFLIVEMRGDRVEVPKIGRAHV